MKKNIKIYGISFTKMYKIVFTKFNQFLPFFLPNCTKSFLPKLIKFFNSHLPILVKKLVHSSGKIGKLELKNLANFDKQIFYILVKIFGTI